MEEPRYPKCLMFKRFGSRLRPAPISEVNTRNRHDRLYFTTILGLQDAEPRRVQTALHLHLEQLGAVQAC
jgi:hypothetical protein